MGDSPGGPSALLGRAAEQGEVDAFLGGVAGGATQGLLIAGEPGIGKTALAKDLAARAGATGMAVAWTWCWNSDEVPHLWPWRQAGAQLGWAGVDWEAPAAAAFDALRPHLGGDEAAPTIVIFDDAHGADEPSLSLVNAILRSLGGISLGLVLTVCEEDVPQGSSAARLLDAISREARRIELFGLADDAVEGVFRRVVGTPPPPIVEQAVMSASRGNPFLVEQLARDVGAGADLTRPDRSLGFRVPRGADAILNRLVDRLAGSTLAILEVAAVLGRTFTSGLLREVSGEPPEELAHALDEAVRTATIRRIDSLGTFEFAHVLLREMLYERLPDHERARLHRIAAESLERSGRKDDLGALAQHLFKAGVQDDAQHAVDVIVRAGRSAASAGAVDEAARQLYRAGRLARAAGLPEGTIDSLDRERATLEADTEDAADPLDEVPAPAPVVPGRSAVFQRSGEFWRVGFGDQTSMLRHTKGMEYLAKLLASPNVEWHATDLAGSADGSRTGGGDTGPVLDREAKLRYRARLAELEEAIDEAAAFNDEGRRRIAEEEKAFLIAELSSAVGLGGRDRMTGSVSERARVAVTRAIRAALRRVAAAEPDLAAHLDRTIRTGTFVAYDPDPMAIPNWEF